VQNHKNHSYRKQIACQLRKQYVEGIYSNSVTSKSGLQVHSFSLKMVPFENLATVSYLHSIVTIVIS